MTFLGIIKNLNILSLLYLSHSTGPLGAIDGIIATSRARNPSLGLTGALLFTGDYFAQVLEGTAESIDTLMAKVRKDRRHEEIIVIAREPIVTRRFGSWSMAYSGPSQFVARHVTRLLNDPAPHERDRSADWLNDLLWEFTEGPGAR